MTVYRVTFGPDQSSPWLDIDHQGWLEVEADDEDAARSFLAARFGSDWCSIYSPERFPEHYFPNGCFARFVADPVLPFERQDIGVPMQILIVEGFDAPGVLGEAS